MAGISIFKRNSNGVTSDLEKRICQHRNGVFKNAFTSKYNVYKLVYFEDYDSIKSAIAREKQLKAGSRKNKIDLINNKNPHWEELDKSI